MTWGTICDYPLYLFFWNLLVLLLKVNLMPQWVIMWKDFSSTHSCKKCCVLQKACQESVWQKILWIDTGKMNETSYLIQEINKEDCAD